MTDDELHKRLEKEQEKLYHLRKEEGEAYYKFNQARQQRDFQEQEVQYLFRKLFDRVAQS